MDKTGGIVLFGSVLKIPQVCIAVHSYIQYMLGHIKLLVYLVYVPSQYVH